MKNLPYELEEARKKIWDLAKAVGLDCYETIFEMVTYDQMNQFAAYGGFPVRYPHWKFGMEYDKLSKSYEYGLSKIYEMVINNDPCYAYLMEGNRTVDQKLVMAHVYGHCDFFKNNKWFEPTDRKMMDTVANHATRIRRYMDVMVWILWNLL
jgi:stage V sporulation protein R